MKVEPEKIDPNTTVSVDVSVDVMNLSGVDGKEVVQVYVFDPIASVVRFERQLLAFSKVQILKHSTESVKLSIPLRDLAFYDSKMRLQVESGVYVLYVGNDSTATYSANITVLSTFYY